MPNTITDERCMLCGAIKSDEHFLWAYPRKQPMWDTLLTRFFDQNARLTFDEIFRPHPISVTMRLHWQLDSFQVAACGVLCLWRLHWKHAFDGSPFWPNEAAARATIFLCRIHQESLYQGKFKDNNQTSH
ncbi:hypothetical protein G6F43_006761 [Rhizopus delemar]|nr:hypothetical protein G6F43_006761 [Rhizopus delemar]